MSGTRKRRGTTLVELSLVIAILAMIALPFAAFVSQNLKNTVLSSTQLREQIVLEQVMQDMEKHLRSAVSMNGTTPCPITPVDGNISFTSRDPQPTVDPPLQPAVVTTHPYTYELRADGLFYKNGVVFPDGLEANMITSLTFPTWSLDPTNPPCYITVRIGAGDITLKRTVYLRNYTSMVDIAKILGVAPVVGGTPVATVDTTEYTGTVAWSPVHATFAPGTPYTATITLLEKAGFTLSGVIQNFFTVDGATSVTNPAGSGTTIVVTAIFPATTGVVPVNIAAIPGVTVPVKNATPVAAIAETAQYTGTVIWTPGLVGGKFKTKTVYTATITIIPKPGYTLTGVAANFFTVAGATTVTNSIDSGVVTAVFPATTN
ncbi:MAG: hypothetical protein WC625_02040 [Caldisericia bacterium]